MIAPSSLSLSPLSPYPISWSSCHDLPYLPWRTIKIVLKARPNIDGSAGKRRLRSTSFRRVEIETPRCFTVCTFREKLEVLWTSPTREETWSATRFAPPITESCYRLFSICILCLSIFPAVTLIARVWQAICELKRNSVNGSRIGPIVLPATAWCVS